MSKREKQLREQADKIRKEVYALEEKRNQRAFLKLKGKCFRYRNSYSCPDGEKDRWWLYVSVKSVKNGWVYVDRFQTDKDGKMEAEFYVQMSGSSLVGGGYIEIPKGSFDLSRRAFLHALNRRLK